MDYRDILEQDFQTKKLRNRYYSLRCYARDLELNNSSLSHIFSKERHLPEKEISSVLSKLNLTKEQETLFKKSFTDHKIKLDKLQNIPRTPPPKNIPDELIPHWNELIALSFLLIEKKGKTVKSISQYFGISLEDTQALIQKLKDNKLIAIDQNGCIQRTTQKYLLDYPGESKELQSFHTRGLQEAIKKLKSTPVKEKDFSTTFITLSKKQIYLYKKLIREFLDKLIALSESEETDELYQISISLSPLKDALQ